MEIQRILKDYHKQLNLNHSSLLKNLKEIKTILYSIQRQYHPHQIQHHKQNVYHFQKQLNQHLKLQQRKVLSAYIDFHFQSISNPTTHSHTMVHPKLYNSYNSKITNSQQPKNQNKLLEIFLLWFNSNFHIFQLHKKTPIFLSHPLNQTQTILTYFESLHSQQLFESPQFNQRIESLESQLQQQQKNKKSKNIDKSCEITLLLTVLIQVNLSILRFQQQNIKEINFLILKAQKIIQKLTQQIVKKDKLILSNTKAIQKVRNGQEKQLGNNFANEKGQKDENSNEERKKKTTKLNDELYQKSKAIFEQKVKNQRLINNMKQLIVRIKSNLLLDGQCKIQKMRNKSIQIRLFQSEKINRAFNNHINTKQSNKQFSTSVFKQQNGYKEDGIYLSVDKNKSTMDISLKDYFNMCLFMKKNNKNREAIVYFQILVYEYKKKQLLSQYFLVKKSNQYKIEQKDERQKVNSKKQSKNRNKKQLQKFLKSQQLISILLFSLTNLYELYLSENAHHWANTTLEYLSEILSLKIIPYWTHLQEQLSQNHSENQSLKQDQDHLLCNSLLQKYTHYLQQIKFKLIKSSLHINPLSQNTQKNKNHPQIYLTRSLDSHQRTHRQSVPLHLTLNMKKLHEKQKQLTNLLSRQNKTKILSNQYSLTGLQTPLNLQKTKLTKYSDKNILKEASKKLRQKMKGSSYEKRTVLTKETFRKTVKKATFPGNNQEISNHNQKEQYPNLTFERSKQLRFNLKPQSTFNKSLNSLDTQKSIGFKMKSSKKHTLKFLQTSKSLYKCKKSARTEEFHRKLLQSKEELQQYIRLSFQKLDSALKNPYVSTISLDEIKIQNIDNSLQLDEILSDFNSLLESLKTFRSFNQESFQRQLLIEAKLRVYEMIKLRSRHQKLIEILSNMMPDINLLRNNQKRTQFHKEILKQLAEIYFEMKEYKKCIMNYLELGKMGQTLSYLKIGQIYMMTREYENSIKYHEKYANEKSYDLQSKVKLAHAYSKVPQYFMKTIDMLTGILIATGSSSKFKQEIYERKYQDRLIESAVILLSSLYFKNQNIQKAIELCQNYSKINIKNYRILHILGGYYRYKNNERKAFQCYLSALQNNPTHHKSLIQLTQFICAGSEYKTHAIQLLRKCFCLESRNIDLLTTLIKFLKDQEPSFQQEQKLTINYKTLLEYAQILKNSQSKGYSGSHFYLQAILVYEWAISLVQKNACIANLEQIQLIYKNLGEISLKQGDYIKSQNYYKLYLMQIEKQVNRSNLNQNLRQQKIQKTKIQIYFFLGKVKKHQKHYKKAVDYFNKSYQLQTKYHINLPHFQSYFYLFQVGYCYFHLQDYDMAISKFLQQKNYLLTLLSLLDPTFFQDQIKSILQIPSYLKINQSKEQKIKKILQKDQKVHLNQNIHAFNQQKQEQKYNIDHVLKRNFIENQIHLAFCYDKINKFIQSKEIYKKILDFFKQVQNQMNENKRKNKTGKKMQSKENLNSRQSYFKKILSNDGRLNEEYLGMKKVCLINLATIYKVQGIENKYDELIRQCRQLYPQKFSQYSKRQESFTSKDYIQSKDNILSQNQTKIISSNCEVQKQTDFPLKKKFTAFPLNKKQIPSSLNKKQKNIFSVSLSDFQDN